MALHNCKAWSFPPDDLSKTWSQVEMPHHALQAVGMAFAQQCRALVILELHVITALLGWHCLKEADLYCCSEHAVQPLLTDICTHNRVS